EFDKLTQLINRLLTLARAESGDLRLDIRVFDEVAVLRNVVETFRLVAAEKNISLHFNPPQVLDIEGDPQWIETAVLNLLDNAIKYTPSGGTVWLEISRQPLESRIEVRDNGIDISKSAVPRIFERFYRADPARAKEVDGVG